MLPQQKTKQQIEEDRRRTAALRQETEEMERNLLKIQATAPVQQTNQKKTIQTTQQKSLSEMQSTGIQISGVNGSSIRPGSGKPPVRQPSAKPVIRTAEQTVTNRAPTTPTKKPMQVLDQISTQKQKNLMQEYNSLYDQAMKGIGPRANKSVDFDQSMEMKAIRQVTKNFESLPDNNKQVDNTSTNNTSTQNEKNFGDDDIFNNDQTHDMGCGGDPEPEEQQKIVKPEQSEGGTQAASTGSYMDQIQTNLILSKLMDENRPMVEQMERKKELIKKILEEEGDDDINVEDVLKELAV
ncbi:Conserved_hypothetical protein [Hexamita inflata]|uniref:Uncharacterized protein n=1 Tax=Hexamita inflata TaxID=28002 RepID=A0AA86V345_9EUKA|nr:Conserved hypothetical protein [Hexamita inflata]